MSSGPTRSVRTARADRIALALLVVLPILLYVPFTIAGHPLMPGDDLVQNYPLRVLAGNLVRAGRLPTWDPLIWSGTPLLAGWNGGSMFPGTLLFAVVPNVAAWTVNYVVTPIVGATGFYLLLRRLSCGPFAALFGALCFTYTGFMNGQVAHIGLLQGTALIPWSLLALDSMAKRGSLRGRSVELLGPIALLGAASALIVLAGDPRAVTTAGIVDLAYVLALIWRDPRRSPRLMCGALCGAVLGALLSAVQWFPGLRFIAGSQRGKDAYGFYGAGSLNLGQIAHLLVVPFLTGGNGNLNMPFYAGPYNFPELTIGCGVLALIALMAYLPRVLKNVVAWRPSHLGRNDSASSISSEGCGADDPWAASTPCRERALGLWYVLFVLGVILALGSNTPLGHVLADVPLYGGERLQSRNAAIFDCSLAVLLGFFLDDLIARAPRRHPLEGRASQLLAAIPLLAMAALIAVAEAAPLRVENALGIVHLRPWLFADLTPLVVWQLLLGGAGAVLIVRPRHLTSRRARTCLALFALFDLGLFAANESYAAAPSSIVRGATGASDVIARVVAPGGRYAVFDPTVANPSTDPETLNDVGESDLNILQDNTSVQGYGSLVASSYEEATATHAYEDLDQARLAGRTFNVLDLSVLLTVPSSFQQQVPLSARLPASQRTWKLSAAGGHATFELARPRAITSITLRLARPASEPSALQIWIRTPSGPHILGLSLATGAAGATVRLVAPTRATGVVVTDETSAPVELGEIAVAVPSHGVRLVLDGPLQGDLEPPHWRYEGVLDGFVVYRNTEAGGPAWLQATGAPSPDPQARVPGSVTSTIEAGTDAEQMVVVAPHPVLLVRSETYSPGWSARITPLGGGPTRVVAASRFGLVQAVELPAGRYEVIWRYAPLSILAGLVGSGIGLVLLALLLVVARRPRHQHSLFGRLRGR